MKTKVVLKSEDRNLFGVIIRQETKTGFLSVSDLQQAFEVARWEFGWSERRTDAVMKTNEFKERVYYILKEKDLVKQNIFGFMEELEKVGVTKTLKNLGVYRTTGKGNNKTVMADPYIWILLAMELNPMIYAKVVIWLTDTLVFDRMEAGDEFMPMNNAIKNIISNPDYKQYAIAINKKVFGKHFAGMRNLATSYQLKEIAEIERFITKSIKTGNIKTEQQIFSNINNY